jgi:predicted CopG family antitoxin
MAVKTITIDLEAYETLARHKRAGQSFSEVIKEHFGRAPTGRDLLAAVKRSRVADDTIEKIEIHVKARQRSRAKPVRL